MKKLLVTFLTLGFVLFGATGLMATNQVVTSTANSGAGTLRQAISDVGDGETITFNIVGSDAVIISSELSITSKGMTINGYNNATGNNVTIQVTTPGSGGTASRIFHINASGKTFNFSNMTIKGGDVSGNSSYGTWGGGIFFEAGTLDLNTVTISGSKAIHGGGIFNRNTSPTLTNCTISGNSTVTNVYGYGGGMRNYSETSASSPTLTNCTISGNLAKNGGGVFSDGTGYPTLTNCTISGNTATNGGGGIFNYSGTLTITNCTVSGNTINGGYGGGINSGSTSSIYIKNTILANNTSADFYKNSNGNSLVYNNGYNLVESCYNYAFSATGDITGEQANLNLRSTLADNGSSNGTKTLALFYDGSTASVAIDAGSNSGDNNGVSIPTTDQRGAERYDFTTESNVQSSTDIGAYENWTGDDTSLPVELSSFTANNQNGSVLLKWSTESECENLGFLIEKQELDAGYWTEIANYLSNPALKGQGSTTEAQAYQFTDRAVQSGVTYEYRLGDVDYTGKVTWHGEIEVTSSALPVEFGLQKAYPNPFNPTTTISYQLASASFVKISIYSVNGKLIETLVSEQQDRGDYSVIWDASGLNSGIYIYKITVGKQTRVNKCLLVK